MEEQSSSDPHTPTPTWLLAGLSLMVPHLPSTVAPRDSRAGPCSRKGAGGGGQEGPGPDPDAWGRQGCARRDRQEDWNTFGSISELPQGGALGRRQVRVSSFWGSQDPSCWGDRGPSLCLSSLQCQALTMW